MKELPCFPYKYGPTTEVGIQKRMIIRDKVRKHAYEKK